MTLDLSKRSVDFLMTLDAKPFRQVMRKVLMLLTDSQPHDSQLLVGYEGVWRADIGEFRIAYRIGDNSLRILIVGRRNDDAIYRDLARMMK